MIHERRPATVALLMVVTISLAAAVLPAQEVLLAPAREGLRAVPLPALDIVEAPVAEQIRSAQREVERAAERGGGSGALAEAYGSLARVCHAYELFDSAEPAYLNAARLAPSDGTWPYLLGYLFQQVGRLDDAAIQLSRAQQVQPDRREASARLADVYVGLNRLRDAREQYQALQDVFPALAASGLGDVALREGRFTDAVQHFRAALARAPQATAVHYSLAMAYRGLGRLDQANAELERRGPGIIRLGDPAVDALSMIVRGERLLVVRGKQAFDAGDFRQAAAWFSRALADAPDSVTARTNLGATFVQLGEPDKAIEQFEAALRIDPADEQTATNLAIVLADRARFRDAVAVLSGARARSPDSTALATTLARLLAAAPDRTVRDGARALDLALGVYAGDAAAVHAETVALALAELGRCAEAREWMRRAVSLAAQAADAAEAARLKGESQKYQAAQCRR